MYKVLITTSGIGSRLGEFTKHTNKTLMRVGEMPALSHIIESYAWHTKFVITLGHFSEHVKEFLEIAYPGRNFEFVYIDKFEGEGSSLLYSMSQAIDVLQCPFIFHTSDTIVKNNYIWSHNPNDEIRENFIVGAKTNDHSSYSSFDVFNGEVIKMHHKGEANTDYTHIGVIGIKDYKEFWNLTLGKLEYSSKELSDVDVLKLMISTKTKFKFIEAKGWHDVGNIDKLNETRKAFSDDSLHVLDKLGESIFKIDDYVVKFFADSTICKNRVLRVKHLNGTTPEITSSGNYFYKYPFIEGELFAECVDRNSFMIFLAFAEEKLWVGGNDKVKEVCKDFYITKTKNRINDFLSKRNIEDKIEIINGRSVTPALHMIDSIEDEWLDLLSEGNFTQFHGDFILDNVIKIKGGFKLIDWRQDFGGILNLGDKNYDLAKLAHNLVVNHGIIDNNNFSVKTKEGKIFLDIHRLQSLVECEEILFEHIKEKFGPLELKKIKILRSIIWLNMAALHHHPFDLFLYYYGRYTLDQLLNT